MFYLIFEQEQFALRKEVKSLNELLNLIKKLNISDLKQANFKLTYKIDHYIFELVHQDDFGGIPIIQENYYVNCQICQDGPHNFRDFSSHYFKNDSLEFYNKSQDEDSKIYQSPQKSQQNQRSTSWADWFKKKFSGSTSSRTKTDENKNMNNKFHQTTQIGHISVKDPNGLHGSQQQRHQIDDIKIENDDEPFQSTRDRPQTFLKPQGIQNRNSINLYGFNGNLSNENFCPYPPAECLGVINATCRKKHSNQNQSNFCKYSAGKCPFVRFGSCSKEHRPDDNEFKDNVCSFLASDCPEVQNGTCSKKHKKEIFEENFCKFWAVECPDVYEGTCKKKHRKPDDEGDVCIYPVSQCKVIQNGTCRKQHKAENLSIQVNTCIYTVKTCPDLINEGCKKLHLMEKQIQQSAICQFTTDQCPDLLRTGFCDKQHQNICKFSQKKCRAHIKGQCKKQHKVVEEEEDIIKVFQTKSRFNIFATKLPIKPFQTVVQEFQQKFKHVKFVQQQSCQLIDIDDLTEAIQTVELSGQKASVDKVLLQLTERVNDLDVDTLFCPDTKIAKKIDEDYKKNIQQQFTVSMTLRVSQKIFVITGDKNGVQMAKKEIINCIDLIRACALNEELVPLPGAPNKALADLLIKNSTMIQKLKNIYQITDIQIDQNRIKFMASSANRQAAQDAFQDLVSNTLKDNEIIYLLTDKDKVKFAKKFQNQLSLIAKGTKLEFLKQKLGGIQESGYVKKSVFVEQEHQPAPYAWAYEVNDQDGNYKKRIDTTIDWFFYDWDQNEQIEAYYNEVKADPNLWINGYKMPEQVVGDMLLQRNGFKYEMYCLSNVDANSHTFSVDQQSTRFRQKNISVAPFRVRKIARFDRPCHNMKPKQSSLVALDQQMADEFENDSVHAEVLKLTGLRDSIQNVINELNNLYADKRNHKMSITLSRNPSTKEFQMIKAYIEKNFEAEVRLAKNDNVAELQITGMNQGQIKNWVAEQLLEFLQKNFPDEWEDSLEQFCQKTTLKIYQVSIGNKLWNEINKQFNEKKPNINSKILSIQIIQNLNLWSVYQEEIKNLYNRDKKPPLVFRLWHGSSTNPPAEVYKKDGLNIAYSADSGLWGRGIYFAVNANYSCPKYSFKVPGETDVYEVFSANAVVGNFLDTGTNTYKDMRQPPLIPGSTDVHYDAIKGHTNGSDVFIVYKNVKTYPGLLVRYQL